jgi:hypothetical protein
LVICNIISVVRQVSETFEEFIIEANDTDDVRRLSMDFSGLTITVISDAVDTVSDVKQVVSDEMGVKTDFMKMVHSSKTLTDDFVVGGLPEVCRVTLVVSMLGGASPGGVKKTIGKKSTKAAKTHKDRTVSEIDEMVTLIADVTKQTKVFEEIRVKILDMLSSKDSALMSKELHKLPPDDLVDLLSEVQKGNNSDYKMTLFARAVFSEEIDKLDTIARKVADLKNGLRPLADYMCMKEIGSRDDDKRNVAGITKLLKNVVKSKIGGGDASDDEVGTEDSFRVLSGVHVPREFIFDAAPGNSFLTPFPEIHY